MFQRTNKSLRTSCKQHVEVEKESPEPNRSPQSFGSVAEEIEGESRHLPVLQTLMDHVASSLASNSPVDTLHQTYESHNYFAIF